MAGPMKARARMQGNYADVRVLMSHPMETGQRKGRDGKPIPKHFIQNLEVKLNGKTVIEGEISQAVEEVFGRYEAPVQAVQGVYAAEVGGDGKVQLGLLRVECQLLDDLGDVARRRGLARGPEPACFRQCPPRRRRIRGHGETASTGRCHTRSPVPWFPAHGPRSGPGDPGMPTSTSRGTPGRRRNPPARHRRTRWRTLNP